MGQEDEPEDELDLVTEQQTLLLMWGGCLVVVTPTSGVSPYSGGSLTLSLSMPRAMKWPCSVSSSQGLLITSPEVGILQVDQFSRSVVSHSLRPHSKFMATF